MNNYSSPPKNQQGIILVAGLILLLILTLAGITSIQSVILSEKMTSNMRDTDVSFQATESALADGEQWIQAQPTKPNPVTTCSSAPCSVWQKDALGQVWSKSQSWWQSNAKSYTTNIYGLSNQPQFIIEEFGFVPYELSPDARAKGQGYHYYKITAHGNGEASTASTMIESIYVTQFN